MRVLVLLHDAFGGRGGIANFNRDLKRLCALDLLIPKGEKRGRTYVAAPALRVLWSDTLHRRRSDDPCALARERQTRLLFLGREGCCAPQ